MFLHVLFDQDHTASHGAGLPLSDGVQAGPQHGRSAEGPGAGLPDLAGPANISPEEKEEISRDKSSRIPEGEVRCLLVLNFEHDMFTNECFKVLIRH